MQPVPDAHVVRTSLTILALTFASLQLTGATAQVSTDGIFALYTGFSFLTSPYPTGPFTGIGNPNNTSDVGRVPLVNFTYSVTACSPPPGAPSLPTAPPPPSPAPPSPSPPAAPAATMRCLPCLSSSRPFRHAETVARERCRYVCVTARIARLLPIASLDTARR